MLACPRNREISVGSRAKTAVSAKKVQSSSIQVGAVSDKC